MLKNLFLLSWVLFLLQAVQAQTTLIPSGSNWAYYDSGNEPVDQGSLDWNDISYNASTWSTGNAHLGYGDGDETTLISSSTYTAYVRHSFNVVDASLYASLNLSLTYDDGAVIYLNGTEVWRVNMPTGTISYGTFTPTQSSDNAQASLNIANSLTNGTNVLSVEIHQRSASSSDLSFDLNVTAQPAPVAGDLISLGSAWDYYDAGNEPSVQSSLDWNDSNYNSSTWSNGNAHLGYGDGDEVTTSSSSAITLYTRHSFNVVDVSVYGNLDINLTYDDGAVVYLNGTEVWRVNMPTGSITYGTFAASTSSDNSQASLNIGNTLVNGTNVIAVETHQRSATSSDLSFDLRLSGNAPGTVNVTRGPYLQKAGPNRMTLRWRTATATESVVNYGTSVGSLTQAVSDLTAKTEHEIDITGLAANTTYYYDIANSSAILIPAASDAYFKTSPVVGTTPPVTAWILGDCGTANSNQRAVRDAYYNYIGANHTDMILFLGDNAYNSGTDNEYQYAIFENMYEDKLKNTVAWSCLGNHDGYSTNSNNQTGPYYDIFSFPTAGESGGVASGTEAYYSFDYGNIHFICLESYQTDRSVGGTMYNWALSDIQNTTQEWIVAYWHHPPYTKGSHDSDTESNLVEMRNNFLPMLENNGVDLVLSGHSHSYERSYLLNGHYGTSSTFNSSIHTVGSNGNGNGQVSGNGAYEKYTTGVQAGEGAVYITTGSSGKVSSASLNHNAMFYSVSQLGSCVLEVDGNEMNVKFVRNTGAVDDYFTLIKDPVSCTVGASCDDLDPCTTNDVYDSNCGCSGTFQDSDSDGVCDANDRCPGQDDALIGTACNDGDVCTVNDVYDNNCGCSGTFADADSDGVCDANDQCPGQDDALIGTSCNDGDACTTNDVYDANCGCSGTYIDADNDGVCASSDPDDNDPCVPNASSPSCNPCSIVSTEGFESGWGTWNDGGTDARRNANDAAFANTGTFCVRIQDNTGAASSIFTDNINLSSYADATVDFSFYPTSMENGEDFFLEVSIDGGTNYTIVGEWNAGTEFQNNTRYNESVSITSINFTTTTRFRFRNDASTNNDRIYLDDIVIQGCGTVTCTPGTTCDDGDACTTGDIYDANCGCAGTFQDADSDGVCDADDQCPGQNDALIGTSCNDGDACTINDVYDANCGCSGTYVDADGDGYCAANDLDDNDGCVPDANNAACNPPCVTEDTEGFESGWGIWADGGSDAGRSSNYSAYANNGTYCIRLRDNTSTSVMTTSNQDYSAYDELTVDFSYIVVSFEGTEDFWLQISTDGGSSYTTVEDWVRGTDFNNDERHNPSITISGPFTTNTRLRFRADASGNSDWVYIDDVVITGCTTAAPARNANTTIIGNPVPDTPAESPAFNLEKQKHEMKVFPNPTSSRVTVSYTIGERSEGVLILTDFTGRILKQVQVEGGTHQQQIDVSHLPAGYYQIYLTSGEQRLSKRLSIVR